MAEGLVQRHPNLADRGATDDLGKGLFGQGREEKAEEALIYQTPLLKFGVGNGDVVAGQNGGGWRWKLTSDMSKKLLTVQKGYHLPFPKKKIRADNLMVTMCTMVLKDSAEESIWIEEGMVEHVMTFEVGKVLEDTNWQAPVYCFEEAKAKGKSIIKSLDSPIPGGSLMRELKNPSM